VRAVFRKRFLENWCTESCMPSAHPVSEPHASPSPLQVPRSASLYHALSIPALGPAAGASTMSSGDALETTRFPHKNLGSPLETTPLTPAQVPAARFISQVVGLQA
jgi:hypothetical protein